MAQLYGRMWTREELARRAGLIEQIGGVRLLEMADGRARGSRLAQLRTGSGLCANILLERGMDIYDAEFQGVPLAWLSPTGPVHPAYFEAPGKGWLRSFGGGLVTTCGFTYAGAAGTDEDEAFGLHGRASALAADHVSYGGEWRGDEYVMFVEGDVRQAVVFGENISLHRRIEATLGGATIDIYDTVRNDGFAAQPFMILYHCNLGFPILDDGARLMVPSLTVTPRDEAAAPGLDVHKRFTWPIQGYREQVFYHTALADGEGYVTAALVNPAFDDGQGLGVFVRYRQAELPRLIEWKMTGEDVYTLGIEPANCLVEGRAKERAEGRLQFLQAGEVRHLHLQVGIVPSVEEAQALEEKAQALLGTPGA